MYRGAIGIIETLGRIGSVEAADAMSKAAAVSLLGQEDVGGGLFAVAIRGDVGSVRAALEAGTHAAATVGEIRGVLFLPRPHDDLGVLLDAVFISGLSRRAPNWPARDQLPEKNVHELRALARDLARRVEFPLKGREISRANRQQLLDSIDACLSTLEETAAKAGENTAAEKTASDDSHGKGNN